MKKEEKNSNKENREAHTIDANGRVLGRLATEIAVLLRGKEKVDFARNKEIGDFVVVQNVDKMRFTGKKLDQKKYYSHSGYFGSLKETPIKKLSKEEVLKRAVYGMLPKNKLRARQIKRLGFEK